MTRFKKSLSESISFINLLVLPVTVGTMIFAESVIRLLFGRGAFDTQAISMTSYALFFYSIGMIGFGLRQILSRIFYSMQDTKTPMINASIVMVMNIILNIILSKFLGIGGLSFIKILCASLVMGLIVKISYDTLLNSTNANLSLILSIGIGAVTYFIIICFMKIEEVDVIVNAVKKRLKRSIVR